MCDCNDPDCTLPEHRCAVCQIQPTGDDEREVCHWCLPLARALAHWERTMCGDGAAWDVFETSRGFLILKDDGADRFESDSEAIAWVRELVGDADPHAAGPESDVWRDRERMDVAIVNQARAYVLGVPDA
jgi:hypothetical protein